MKIIGAILWYIYCLLIIVIPVNAIMGEVSFPIRLLTWIIIYALYMFFPTIVFTVMHILLLVGIYFVHRDFPTCFFILYLILLASFFIRTIVLVIGGKNS